MTPQKDNQEICKCGHDDLAKQIDWDNLLKMPRYAGGHDEQMKGLIKGAIVIGHWNEEDYQGMVATCLKVPCGKFIIYNDYYGSCSGCDAWEDSSDEEVKKMINDLVYTCKIFNTLEEVKLFLSKIEFDEYSWKNSSKGLLKEIKKFTPRNNNQQKQTHDGIQAGNIQRDKSESIKLGSEKQSAKVGSAGLKTADRKPRLSLEKSELKGSSTPNEELNYIINTLTDNGSLIALEIVKKLEGIKSITLKDVLGEQENKDKIVNLRKKAKELLEKVKKGCGKDLGITEFIPLKDKFETICGKEYYGFIAFCPDCKKVANILIKLTGEKN
ncbi:MAG: hypothetical protein M0R17_05660 [Candidatus Omnitrophica bacterium]|jgi:hypothetical protein|nr:hypothetical protein [Candidatus Omnitrophota bacterium]